MSKMARQYGLWDSPISPESLAEDRRLEAARWDSDGTALVWLEGRSGQGVLVAEESTGNAPRQLTAGLNVRAEVGYGGGDFTAHGGTVIFVVRSSGRLYRQSLAGGTAVPITPGFGKACSPVVSPDGNWVAYVHQDEEHVDRIAVVDAAGTHWPAILAEGHDFFMQPRWSHDGRHLAWIAWDHPNMPWDGTTLYLAPVIADERDQPGLGGPRAIAGGQDIAVFQPEFTPDGKSLLFVSDETGWGRLAKYDLKTGQQCWLTPEGVEHAQPAWLYDMRTYAMGHNGAYVVAAGNAAGFQRLTRIDLATGHSSPVDALGAYSDVTQLIAAPGDERIAFVGSSPKTPPQIVECDLATGKTRIVARSSGETVSPAGLSQCEAISWTTAGGERAHGLYYPPASERFEGIGSPPLIVLVHGGPTSQVKAGWKPDAQFFATRGYAVLFVNHRGSTGYGRDYMLRLRGNWGVCDVEDSISGARHLADSGKIDAQRTIIMGGSAGGFTVLQTMATQPEAFAAGVCLYGVADQFHLAAETHKFESRYLDTMLGPLPQAAELYRERSPVNLANRIRRPLAVFQGEEDRVVPQAQSDAIVEALKSNGTPHIYHVYSGEGHGWRKRETIAHFYRTVDEFLRRHVVFA